MNTFTLTSCKVRLPADWSINDQSYPSGRTRGAGFLGVDVGFLMVAKWFAMRYCPWRLCTRVLYLCSCGTLGVNVAF